MQRREEGEEVVLFLLCFLLAVNPVTRTLLTYRLALPSLYLLWSPTQPFAPTHLHTALRVLRGFLMLSLGTALCVSRDGCQRNSGPVVCVNGQTGWGGGG